MLKASRHPALSVNGLSLGVVPRMGNMDISGMQVAGYVETDVPFGGVCFFVRQ